MNQIISIQMNYFNNCLMIIGLLENIYWKLKVWVFDFELCRVWPRLLYVRGHLKSKIYLSFESQYKIFYWHFLAISFRLRYIFTLKYSGLACRSTLEVTWGQKYLYQLKLRLTFFSIFYTFLDTILLQGHLRSDIFLPFEIPYMTSCILSINIFFISRTVFEIFEL